MYINMCVLCFRLEDITLSLSQLKKELMHSYSVICQLLKNRMVDILRESKVMSRSSSVLCHHSYKVSV